MELIKCSVCSEDMPKLRKDLYGYNFCIKCSTVVPKVGRVVAHGQGDNIWSEVEILDQEAAKRVLELEQLVDRGLLLKGDLLNYNEDSDLEGPRTRAIGSVREIIQALDESDKFSETEEEEDEDETSTEEDDLLDLK